MNTWLRKDSPLEEIEEKKIPSGTPLAVVCDLLTVTTDHASLSLFGLNTACFQGSSGHLKGYLSCLQPCEVPGILSACSVFGIGEIVLTTG